jgi:hypothetical protein
MLKGQLIIHSLDDEPVYSHWSTKMITKEQDEEEQRQIKDFMKWYKEEVEDKQEQRRLNR